MESFTTFFNDYSLWGIFVVVIVASVIISILKSLVRIAMIITVIGLVLVVFFNINPQEVMDKGRQIVEPGSELLGEEKDYGLLERLTAGNFIIKKQDGETFIEIESLGLRYSLDNLLSDLQQDREQEIEELNQMIE